MLGSILGAASSLLGGLFGQKSQDKQMNAQIAAQKEFAQSGIQWKVADAQKAGIHPLYALGASTVPFSPIGIGGSPLAEGIQNAGQDIGRAIDAGGTAGQRAYTNKLMQLQLQRGELENAILASDLARKNSPAGMPPPIPSGYGASQNVIPGQNVTPLAERFGGGIDNVKNIPLERMVSDTDPSSEPGSVADVGWMRTRSGGYAPVPSNDANQRMEDQFIPSLGWAFRNVIVPNVYGPAGAPPFKAPPGYRWNWSTMDQSYQLRPYGGKGDRLRKLPN